MSFSPPQGFVASSVQRTELFYDARDFGADPTGTADSTAPIQAMFNAINSNSGGEAYFPAGLYKISSSINLQNKNNLYIHGAGPGLPPGVFSGPISATSFRWTGAASGTMWDCRGVTHCRFQDFGCDSNQIATLTCFLFDGNPTFNASNNCVFMNLSIGDTNSGWSICMKIGVTGNTQVSEFTLIACRFYVYSTYGIQINSQNALNIWMFGCQFQDQTSPSVGTGTGIEVTSGSFQAYGCSFLNNALDVNIGITAQACVLSGFDSEQGNKFLAVGANCAGPLTIDSGNVSVTGSGATANAITIASIAANGSISLRQLTIGNGKNIDVAVGFAQKLSIENITFVGGGAFTTNSFSGTLAGGLKVSNLLGGNFALVNPNTGGVFAIDGADSTATVWIRPDGTNAYKFAQTKVTSFAGRTSAGMGIVPVFGSTLQKSESAADANVLTYTPPATAGSYRMHVVISVSAATAATLGWTATWKDSNGTAQAPTNLDLTKNGVAAPALTFLAAANDTYCGDVPIDIDNSATAIVVKLTFTGTSFTAKVSAFIEQLA